MNIPIIGEIDSETEIITFYNDMKRTPLNKIGKIGKRNIDAVRRLKWIFNDYGITRCELNFPGCTPDMFLAFCHKEKREWYRIVPKLLYSFKHVILGCQNCHDILDDRSKTTKEESDEIFNKLRG
jgi:hypothetical protein